MVKRVGITTDPEERRQHWENEHPSLRQWKIVFKGLTYEQAQEEENLYINKGYQGHPGGEKKPGSIYSVYTFEY